MPCFNYWTGPLPLAQAQVRFHPLLEGEKERETWLYSVIAAALEIQFLCKTLIFVDVIYYISLQSIDLFVVVIIDYQLFPVDVHRKMIPLLHIPIYVGLAVLAYVVYQKYKIPGHKFLPYCEFI
jgi:hypothetical protein